MPETPEPQDPAATPPGRATASPERDSRGLQRHLYDPAPAARHMLDASLRVPPVMLPPDVLSLGIGEPDAGTPQPIVDAMIRALREGWTHYGDFVGDPELREAIARHTTGCTGAAVDAEQVVITNSSSSALAAIMLALTGTGDKVVMPDPTYSFYTDAVHLAGAELTYVARTSEGRLDVPRVIEACRGARLLLLCSPNNPNGDVISRPELEAIADGLAGTDCLVVADEAYDAYTFDGEHTPILAVEGLRERTLLAQTFSKTYAMTGWRLGYIVAPMALAEVIGKTQVGINGAVNAAVQRAGLTALQLGPDPELVARYHRQRDQAVAALRTVPGAQLTVPAGGFYIFLRYPQSMPSVDMVARLSERGLLVRPGAEFGPAGEGAIRVSFAVRPDLLDSGLARLVHLLKTL